MAAQTAVITLRAPVLAPVHNAAVRYGCGNLGV